MKTLHTVNVVETIDGTPRKVVAFSDSKKGNEEAEILFEKICRENGLNTNEIDVCIENGTAPDTKGSNWELFLIHSEGIIE